MFTCFLLTVLSVVFTLVSGFEIKGKVNIPKQNCGKGIEVLLKNVDGGEEDSTYVLPDCQFKFNFVNNGKYSLLIMNSDFEFPYMTLIVDENSHYLNVLFPKDFATKKMVGKKKKDSKEKGYVIPPVRQIQYFVPKAPSMVMGYLKSPMVLFMVFGIFMVVVTPLISNTEEMKETQQMLGGGLKKFQGYLDNTYDGMKSGKMWDKSKDNIQKKDNE